jgi:hypothetical protein
MPDKEGKATISLGIILLFVVAACAGGIVLGLYISDVAPDNDDILYQSNFATDGAWTLNTTTPYNTITFPKTEVAYGAIAFQNNPTANYQTNPKALMPSLANNGVFEAAYQGATGTEYDFLKLDVNPALGGSYPWTVFPNYQGRMANISFYCISTTGTTPVRFHTSSAFDLNTITWNNMPTIGADAIGAAYVYVPPPPNTAPVGSPEYSIPAMEYGIWSIPYSRYVEFDIGSNTGWTDLSACQYADVHLLDMTPYMWLYVPKLVQNSSCVLMQSNTTEFLTMASPVLTPIQTESLRTNIVDVTYEATTTHSVNITLWDGSTPIMTTPIIPEGNTQQSGDVRFEVPQNQTITQFSFNGTVDDQTFFRCDSISIQTYSCTVNQPAPNVAYTIIPGNDSVNHLFTLSLSLTNDTPILNDPAQYIHSIAFSFSTLSIGVVSIPPLILDCAINQVPMISFNLTQFGVPQIDNGTFNFTGTIEYLSGVTCGVTYLTKSFTFQYPSPVEVNETVTNPVSVSPPSSIGNYSLEIFIPLVIIGIAYIFRKRRSFISVRE